MINVSVVVSKTDSIELRERRLPFLSRMKLSLLPSNIGTYYRLSSLLKSNVLVGHSKVSWVDDSNATVR